MKSCAVAAFALALASGIGQINGATLYQQNFEPPVPTSSNAAAFGGFGQVNNISSTGWQVQGGGGGGGISVVTGVDTNGAGGGQALFANFDHAAATSFTFNQYTAYGLTAPGAGTTLAQVQVAMDVFMSGSESANNPIEVVYRQNNADAESWAFRPTLANGAYTHVQFTLDQVTQPAVAFNPLSTFALRVQHGAGGFGFDANNIVRIDNILVQTVPEPASIGLAAFGVLGAIGLRQLRGWRRNPNL